MIPLLIPPLLAMLTVQSPAQFTPLADDVAALSELLDSPSAAVRLGGALGLAWYGVYALPALPKLIEHFGDEEQVAKAAAMAAGYMGPDALAALRAALREGEDAHREYACHALAIVVEGGDRRQVDSVLPDLIAALNDPQPQVRRAAERAIAALRWTADPAIPVLIARLSSDSPEDRFAAGQTLQTLGEAIVAPLLVVLAGEDEGARVEAAEILGNLRYATPQVVAPLGAAIDRGGMTARAAARALTHLADNEAAWAEPHGPLTWTGFGDTSAAQELVKAYQRLPEARQSIIQVLGEANWAPASVLPIVLEALRSGDEKLSQAAVETLRVMAYNVPEAMAVLLEMFGDPATSAQAMQILSTMGPTAEAALRAQLWSGDKAKRQRARDALNILAPTDPQTALEWARSITDPQTTPEERYRLMYELTNMGRSAEAAVPVLCDGLLADDQLVRQYSAMTLGWLGPQAAAAVPALTAVLDPADFLLCQEAIIALGKIGSPASSALPALEKLKADDLLGQTARAAIGTIQPAPAPSK